MPRMTGMLLPEEVEREIRRAVQLRWQESKLKKPAVVLDRYLGCLLGGGVGDALGAPVEFMSLADIREAHGKQGVRDYLPAYGRLGAITDDTQMTLFTAEGLLRAWVRRCMRGIGPVFPSVTDYAYGRWMRTQGEQAGFDKDCDEEPNGWLITHKDLFAIRAPGLTCLTSLREKSKAGEPAQNDSKGCGGVMRVAPVGLICAALHPGRDRQERDAITFELGCDIAALTHGHPSGRLSAGYLAVLIGALVEGSTWAEAHARARRPLAAAPSALETLQLLDEAIRLAEIRPIDTETLEQLGQGWVAEEALAMSVYCAASVLAVSGRIEEAFERSVLLSVNHGGDSDSTGALTGNIVGAALGKSCIPARFLEPLELRCVIEEIAEDLATVGVWDVGEYESSSECNYWWNRYPGG